jgi:hypothetical protein
MLAVTEAAGTLLARMLEDEEVPEGLYVRFSFEGEDTVNGFLPRGQDSAHPGHKDSRGCQRAHSGRRGVG